MTIMRLTLGLTAVFCAAALASPAHTPPRWQLAAARAAAVESGAVPNGLVAPHLADGTPVALGDFPYAVSLAVGGQHFCMATLISPTQMVTTHTCMAGLSLDELTVEARAGFVLLSAVATAQVRLACKVDLHPTYDLPRGQNDAAVVTVDTPFDVGPTVNVLPPVKAPAAPGTVLDAVAWGFRSGASMDIISDALQVYQVQVLDPVQGCPSIGSATYQLLPSAGCALPLGAGDTAGFCFAEGGAPLVANAGTPDAAMAGMASVFDDQCGSTQPRVFGEASWLAEEFVTPVLPPATFAGDECTFPSPVCYDCTCDATSAPGPRLNGCVHCPEGTASPSTQRQKQCLVCPPGSFSVGDGACNVCPPGTVSRWSGAAECEPCNGSVTDASTHTVEVHLVYDNLPAENRMVVSRVDGATLTQVFEHIPAFGGDPPTSDVVSFDVQAGVYLMELFDAFGDGMCCNFGEGRVTVYVDDVWAAAVDTFFAFTTSAFVGVGLPSSCPSSGSSSDGGASGTGSPAADCANVAPKVFWWEPSSEFVMDTATYELACPPATCADPNPPVRATVDGVAFVPAPDQEAYTRASVECLQW